MTFKCVLKFLKIKWNLLLVISVFNNLEMRSAPRREVDQEIFTTHALQQSIARSSCSWTKLDYLNHSKLGTSYRRSHTAYMRAILWRKIILADKFLVGLTREVYYTVISLPLGPCLEQRAWPSLSCKCNKQRRDILCILFDEQAWSYKNWYFPLAGVLVVEIVVTIAV